MKKRHIIMLSILIIALLIVLMLLSEKNTKNLKCTLNGEFLEMESTSTINVKIKKNKVRDMNLTINAKLTEEYESQKQSIIDSINMQGKMTAKSTSDGIELTANMHSGYFDSLGLSKDSSYEELKQIFELQGYTCE